MSCEELKFWYYRGRCDESYDEYRLIFRKNSSYSVIGLNNLINKYNSLRNGVDVIYVTIYDWQKLNSGFINTIMFDIDGKTIDDVFYKFLELRDYLNSYNIKISRLYLSSNHGMHAYVDLNNYIYTKIRPRFYLKQIYNNFRNVVDTTFSGIFDLIPGTVNFKHNYVYHRVNANANSLSELYDIRDNVVLNESNIWAEYFGGNVVWS